MNSRYKNWLNVDVSLIYIHNIFSIDLIEDSLLIRGNSDRSTTVRFSSNEKAQEEFNRLREALE